MRKEYVFTPEERERMIDLAEDLRDILIRNHGFKKANEILEILHGEWTSNESKSGE